MAEAIYRTRPGRIPWEELSEKGWKAEYRRKAQAAIDALGLELETNPCHPISVPEVDDEGNPVMDEKWVQPVQKHHFEWVTMQRWVTPWEEVGERETSEQLSARLEAQRNS